VRDVHPEAEVRVSFSGPTGPDPADQVVPVEALSAASTLEVSTRFGFTVGTWAPGTYSVTALGEGGAAAAFTVPCPPLPNEPPRARPGGPYQGSVGVPVTFDGRLSADPDGAPLAFSWFFDDGGTASGPRPSHTFDTPGTYEVLLVVNDGELDSPTSVGTDSYATVTIGPAAPSAPLGSAALWVGLLNSDDQGTQFDLRVEVYSGTTLVASGEARCITGITRDPRFAKAVSVPVVGAVTGPATVKILTRIGTTAADARCPGPGGSHASARGLRLYYDAAARASRAGDALYLHGNDIANATAPGGTAAKQKDSAVVSFGGGNPWRSIGTWHQ
jgi:PKD repeat protein